MNDAYLDRERGWTPKSRRGVAAAITAIRSLPRRVEPTTTDLAWMLLVMALLGALMAA